ncbi:MAG: glycosyltransferase family A protein [Eubacteriales bacterium]|nr:glycosyltransferase family A protein [Eubacteriales bacterium]
MPSHVEICVSTMHLSGDAVPSRMRLAGHRAFFINQCGRTGERTVSFSGCEFPVCDSDRRGLSRSRNMALERAQAEFLWLCDDDVAVDPAAEQTILSAFAAHPEADAIAFNVPSDTPDRPQRPIEQEHPLLLRNSMRYPSYRFVYRLASLRKAGLRFDERFGSGSTFSNGEDSLFTAACLKAGLKLVAVPKEIARVRHADSGWFSGYDEKYLRDKGALFEAIFGFGLPYCALMLLRHPDWRGGRSFFAALGLMRRGAREFRKGGTRG